MALTAKYSPALSDVFLYFGGEKTEAKPDIFAGSALKYLRQREGKKLILLDEIGGVELMNSEFRRELYNVLEGDIPCIGVLKLEAGNRRMCENSSVGCSCINYYLKLRSDLLNRFGAEIVQFDRKSPEEPEKAVNEFIQAVFG